MKIVILGAGPGGYVSAIKAAQLGADVVIIESTEVGGTCLNWGCIPSKSMLASSAAFARAQELNSFGIDLDGTLSPNMKKIIERKNGIVLTQIKGIHSLFKSWNITLMKGIGRFISPDEMRIELSDGSEETVNADAFIIATGSRPLEIPALPFDGKHIISSTEALELPEVPRNLLIVGAGVIGCEFAYMYRQLGSNVTIVERLRRAVSTEDEAISKLLERELKKKKIRLITGVTVERVSTTNTGMIALLSNGEKIATETVLASIGRALNSDGIGLEEAGVSVGQQKEIIVNNRLQTTAPGIYAIGDVTGGIMLAHVASKQGITAVENIMGNDRTIDYSIVPSAIFTSPEIGSVGLREHQAREKGLDYTTGEFQFRALGKAHAIGEISGFIKVIADKESDRILGAHIIGPRASDLVHEYAVAMKSGLKIRDVAETIHAHPTLSEGLMEAAEDVHQAAIHAAKK